MAMTTPKTNSATSRLSPIPNIPFPFINAARIPRHISRKRPAPKPEPIIYPNQGNITSIEKNHVIWYSGDHKIDGKDEKKRFKNAPIDISVPIEEGQTYV